ncbi:hypothetical protein HDU81_000734 [Chytriomyces hyalinus]|nr:hypothetical protein HDU81_000734 [Chytriomyces hyalinus]
MRQPSTHRPGSHEGCSVFCRGRPILLNNVRLCDLSDKDLEAAAEPLLKRNEVKKLPGRETVRDDIINSVLRICKGNPDVIRDDVVNIRISQSDIALPAFPHTENLSAYYLPFIEVAGISYCFLKDVLYSREKNQPGKSAAPKFCRKCDTSILRGLPLALNHVTSCLAINGSVLGLYGTDSSVANPANVVLPRGGAQNNWKWINKSKANNNDKESKLKKQVRLASNQIVKQRRRAGQPKSNHTASLQRNVLTALGQQGQTFNPLLEVNALAPHQTFAARDGGFAFPNDPSSLAPWDNLWLQPHAGFAVTNELQSRTPSTSSPSSGFSVNTFSSLDNWLPLNGNENQNFMATNDVTPNAFRSPYNEYFATMPQSLAIGFHPQTLSADPSPLFNPQIANQLPSRPPLDEQNVASWSQEDVLWYFFTNKYGADMQRWLHQNQIDGPTLLALNSDMMSGTPIRFRVNVERLQRGNLGGNTPFVGIATMPHTVVGDDVIPGFSSLSLREKMLEKNMTKAASDHKKTSIKTDPDAKTFPSLCSEYEEGPQSCNYSVSHSKTTPDSSSDRSEAKSQAAPEDPPYILQSRTDTNVKIQNHTTSRIDAYVSTYGGDGSSWSYPVPPLGSDTWGRKGGFEVIGITSENETMGLYLRTGVNVIIKRIENLIPPQFRVEPSCNDTGITVKNSSGRRARVFISKRSNNSADDGWFDLEGGDADTWGRKSHEMLVVEQDSVRVGVYVNAGSRVEFLGN